MKLIRIQGFRGTIGRRIVQDYFINPEHIQFITPYGNGMTLLQFATGGEFAFTKLFIPDTVDNVLAKINNQLKEMD